MIKFHNKAVHDHSVICLTLDSERRHPWSRSMSHRKLVLSVPSSGRANGNFIFKNNKLIGLKATEMYIRKRVQVQTVDNSDNDYTANLWI